MRFDQILAVWLDVVMLVFSIVFVWQRLRWRRRRQGFRPSIASLGNALHQLQVIAEPQMRYVIEEKLDEEMEEEESGGPDDPVRHLHRQAAKIRRGDRVDRITARLGSR
ncbi:MAG: hypothetical protein JSS95_08335 [Acidobacteria bacterium]|nr:hypothetical protein [Acidobacteriota bacterium]